MIVAPTIVVQIVAIYVFYYSYVDTISKHMARGVLGEMLFVKNSVYIRNSKQLVSEFSRNVDLKFYFKPGKTLPKKPKSFRERHKDSVLLKFFDPLPLIDPLNRFKIEMEGYGFKNSILYQNPKNDDYITVKTQVKGGVIVFQVPSKRITSSTKYVFTLWMLLTSLLVSIVSILFLRNQIRSIRGLSAAAEKLGRGGDVPDFKPSGPKEIRSVGISFIRMKERVMRQITQRTQMLSAVSHDLRTPLTRMKLQLEMMPDGEVKEEFRVDIADMQKMINEYLEFAKFGSGGEKEQDKNIKIKEFLEKIVNYYQKMDKNIEHNLNIDENLEIAARKGGLKRAMRNLIDNSFNYGTKVVVSCEASKNSIKIIVDDNGCGIPTGQRDNIFRPFYRIDDSRNLDKTSGKLGGAGLGLAIVMDVISSHGGKVKVDDSPLGGLRMVVYLPI
jgi:two-component system osmolarity sensor histidine kinase EnvZ